MNMQKKTPDVVFFKNNMWYIIDVSISIDPHLIEQLKASKYLPIVNFIILKGHVAKYIHVNLDKDYSNIMNEIPKLSDLFVDEFKYGELTRAINTINDKKEWINKYIDKEIFEKLKEKHYSLLNKYKDVSIGKMKIIADELSFDSLGEYKDLDIDLELFKNFNGEFDTLKNIQENIDTNTEQNLIQFFTNVLNNKDDLLYKKYEDEVMSVKQFDSAYQSIKQINMDKPKRSPKPTHHVLISLPDDDPPSIIIEENNTEQNNILKFFENFISETSTITENQKTDDIVFYRDLFKECLFCLNDDIDKQNNKELFFEKTDFLKKIKKNITN